MSTTPAQASEELAAQFEAQRPRLRAIARRTLGSFWDAEDAVQETWVRLQAAHNASIENVPAWLTTVVARVCIDHLRRRSARHEDPDGELPETSTAPGVEAPEAQALHSEELNAALHIVLETLSPLERLAFVLHDVFGLHFDEIAPIVERTPANARQLASRARRRIRSADVAGEWQRRSDAVDAFLRASRHGDFGSLLQLLDPEVKLRSDSEAVTAATLAAGHGAPLLQARLQGADAVARVFGGRAGLVQRALIDGLPGGVYVAEGEPRAVYLLRVDGDLITHIDTMANPGHIAGLQIEML